MFGLDWITILFLSFSLISLFVLAWVLASTVHTCGPNQAMIISGAFARQGELPFRVRVGGSAVILPLLQQKSILSLAAKTVEVHPQTPIITKDGVPLLVDAAALVKVKSDRASIVIAAENILGKSDDEVQAIARGSLVIHLRDIVNRLSLQELNQSFNSVAQQVQEVSLADLAKIGLTVVSFTINEVKDIVSTAQVQ